ncbi:MAG: hypothetical protein MRZ13_00030 [Clostridiales bacterium]|nr:hypothetical protein [Clostridiales bacterium]
MKYAPKKVFILENGVYREISYNELKQLEQADKSYMDKFFLPLHGMLTNAFVKAKSVLLQNSIETKMAEYEVLLNDLETQKAQLELERGYKLTKKDLLVFIEELLKGDVNDKDYQKQIIDHLVSQVFVSDDNTVVYFNIRGGKDIEKLTIDNTKEVVEKVQTQSPLARQVKLV